MMVHLGHLTLAPVLLAFLGCAANHETAAVADQTDPDCSFRSAATCWSIGGRFPTLPQPVQPERILQDSSTILAAIADSRPR